MPRKPHDPELPVNWRKISDFGPDGYCFASLDTMNVILTSSIYGDGNEWLHLSVSRPYALPSYQDVCEVKRIFIGEERKAIMVFPAKEKHVNLHQNCLHLFACLTGDPLPEFSGMIGPQLRSI